MASVPATEAPERAAACLSFSAVKSILRFAGESPNPSRELPLAVLATSPTFRVLADECIGEGTAHVRLKRSRVDDRCSSLYNTYVKHVDIRRGSEVERSIAAVSWWLLRHDGAKLALNTTEYTKGVVRLLSGASSLSVCRRDARTVSWIAAAGTHLQELTFTGCAHVSDWNCLDRITTLRSLKMRGCTTTSLSWVTSLLRLETLELESLSSVQTPLGSFESLKNLRSVTTNVAYTVDLRGLSACQCVENLILSGEVSHACCLEIASLSVLSRLILLDTPIEDISWLPKLPALQELSLKNCKSIVTLPSAGETVAGLRKANLAITSIKDFSWLRDSLGLEELLLYGNSALSSVGGIDPVRGLTTLKVDATPIDDVSWVGKNTSLRVFTASHCSHVKSYAPLSALTSLEQLDLSDSNVQECDWVSDCRELRALSLSRCAAIRSLNALHTLKKLTSLFCDGTAITDLDWMEHLESLECVDLSDSASLAPACTVRRPPPHLRVVFITGAAIKSVSWLAKCPELAVVKLRQCPAIASFDWVQTPPALESLYIGENPNVTDISFLRSCKALKWVKLPDMFEDSYKDILPGVRELYSMYFFQYCPRIF